MKKTVFSLFFLCIFQSLFSQNIESLKVSSFKFNKCSKGKSDICDMELMTRIIRQKQKDNDFYIKILGYGNCCTDFAPIASVKGDTLILSHKQVLRKIPDEPLNPGQPPCDCDCSYEYSYLIKDFNKPNINILVKLGKRIIAYSKAKYGKPHQFELYTGKKINKTDRQGRLTGNLYHFRDKEKQQIFMIHNYRKGIRLWTKVFYKNGNIRKFTRYVGKSKSKEITRDFDENGKLIKNTNQ